jgi:hypothetical protein
MIFSRQWFSFLLFLQLFSVCSLIRADSIVVDLSPEPLTRVLAAHQLAMVLPSAKVDRKLLEKTKTNLLAWLDWKVDGAGKLAVWQTTALKDSLAQGFQGVVLVLRDPGLLKPEGLASGVKQFKEKYPLLKIWLAVPSSFLPACKGLADGWVSMPGANHSEAVRLTEVKGAVAAGWKVFAIDWVLRTEQAQAMEQAAKFQAAGASVFVTTEEMLGICLAPWHHAPRRILVLFGAGDAEPGDPPAFEADTLTATRLQMALEWGGYEVEYFNVALGMPPSVLAGDYAGVIFDARLQLPFGKEKEFADWTIEQRGQGLKLLFIGQYPFEQEVELGRVMIGLGMRGSLDPVKAPRNLKLATLDEKVMNAEARVVPQSVDFNDIRAPLDAQVALGLDATDATANPMHFDAVFTTSWGGAVLDPYLTFQSSGSSVLSFFEPFALLQRIWPVGNFPAPDTTTRCGLRIFYSHIDGDGFVYETGFDKKRLCGEVIRDEVLKKYPYPVTCSVIEAEINADQADLKVADSPRFVAVAKSIFALPNVQAASHSYSHPFIWIEADEDYLPLYEEKNLKLKSSANYPKIFVKREVEGSISYIEKALLPPGKKVELMLWSGNCRPGREALQVCQELGILNLNGGNTAITKRPKTMTWNGLRQIHASNQNEFVYTRNWSGPFFNGFRQVRETFELTEQPRRLKPVNVYYHFYSASQLGALKALTDVLDWSLTQPLHAMTARDFAEMVADSCDVQLLQVGPHSWKMITGGKQRSFRLAANSALPDLPRCQGVLGWCQTPQGLYVHTDDSSVVLLTLLNKKDTKEQVTNRPYLSTCSSPVVFHESAGGSLRLVVDDFRPECQVRLGGLPPKSSWDLRSAGRSERLAVDALGFLNLKLSGRCEADVTPAP